MEIRQSVMLFEAPNFDHRYCEFCGFVLQGPFCNREACDPDHESLCESVDAMSEQDLEDYDAWIRRQEEAALAHLTGNQAWK